MFALSSVLDYKVKFETFLCSDRVRKVTFETLLCSDSDGSYPWRKDRLNLTPISIFINFIDLFNFNIIKTIID